MTSENKMIPEQDIKDLKTKMNQLEAVYVAQGRTDDWITINEWDKVMATVAGTGAAIIALTAGAKNVPFKPSSVATPNVDQKIKTYASKKKKKIYVDSSDKKTIELFEKRMKSVGLSCYTAKEQGGYKVYEVPDLEQIEADFKARKNANLSTSKNMLDGFSDVEKEIDDFIVKGGKNPLSEVLDRFKKVPVVSVGKNPVATNITRTLGSGVVNIAKGTGRFVHRAAVPKSTGGKWGFYVALGTAAITAVYTSLGGEDQSEAKDFVQLTSSSLSKEKREKACAGLGYLLSDDSPLNDGEKEKLLNLQRTSLGTPQGDALMEQLAKIGEKIPSPSQNDGGHQGQGDGVTPQTPSTVEDSKGKRIINGNHVPGFSSLKNYGTEVSSDDCITPCSKGRDGMA